MQAYPWTTISTKHDPRGVEGVTTARNYMIFLHICLPVIFYTSTELPDGIVNPSYPSDMYIRQ